MAWSPAPSLTTRKVSLSEKENHHLLVAGETSLPTPDIHKNMSNSHGKGIQNEEQKHKVPLSLGVQHAHKKTDWIGRNQMALSRRNQMSLSRHARMG
jgi:hypothetical protein